MGERGGGMVREGMSNGTRRGEGIVEKGRSRSSAHLSLSSVADLGVCLLFNVEDLAPSSNV